MDERAEEAANEDGGAAPQEEQDQVKPEDLPPEQMEPEVEPPEPDEPDGDRGISNGSIGDPRYQAGGLATGERGRQSGARIESGEEQQGEPGEDEL